MVVSGLAPCLEDYDALLSVAVAEYLKNSKAIGEDVEKHAEMVNAALQAQRGFVKLASTHQQPPEADLAALLRPISVKIQEIQNFREKNRGSKMFNHLSAVSESIPALGWIAVGPFASVSLMAPPADGPCPPPPPPPGPPPIFEADAPKNNSSTRHTALFAELNQGEAITRGKDGKYWLRHVLDGQKTHKNPELRSQGGVARQSPTKSHTPSPTSPKAPPQSHSPVLELEGKKWRVEYQDHANSLVISETELKHVVYAFKCSNSTLQIKGKINSIVVGLRHVLDGQKTHKNPELRSQGGVAHQSPTKSHTPSPTSPKAPPQSHSPVLELEGKKWRVKEFPVPEQYKTVWDGSKLVTEPTEMAG
ncbi:UNVERIFIED_CONTAM: hypothetical protein FKN15_048503 [Acipenser sinensis]